MARAKVHEEIVNGAETVQFYRHIREVETDDGMSLLYTHKIPVKKNLLAPVMLVHGLGQNRFSWSLSKRSIENYLVANGFETFNVELRGHGLSRAYGSNYPTQFEKYLNYDIPALIHEIRRVTGGKKMFYMGHSLGGAISYCIGAKFQEYLNGIVSIAGPFNMAKGNPILKTMTILGSALGKIARLDSSLIYPDALYIDYIGFAAKHSLFLLDSRFNKIPIQIWWPGSMERDVLIERIEKGFDRTGWRMIKFCADWGATGRFYSSDGKEDFEQRIVDLKIPVLFIQGNRDYTVPPSAVKEAYEKVGTTDKTFKVFGGEKKGLCWGHCDLIFGKEAPAYVWPYILQWMNTRVPGA